MTVGRGLCVVDVQARVLCLGFGGVGVGSYVDGCVPLSCVCVVTMCDYDAACGVRRPFAVYVCLCLIWRQCGSVVVKWSCLVVAV